MEQVEQVDAFQLLRLLQPEALQVEQVDAFQLLLQLPPEDSTSWEIAARRALADSAW